MKTIKYLQDLLFLYKKRLRVIQSYNIDSPDSNNYGLISLTKERDQINEDIPEIENLIKKLKKNQTNE